MKCGGFFHGFSFGAGFELMRRVIVPAILVATPLVLWWWLGPEKPKCDSARSQAARVAVAQVADRIRAERGDIRRAVVLHFTNDSTDYVTRTLRERLMDGGLLDLDGTPPGEKIRSLFNLRNPGTYDVEAAIKYGKKRGLGAVSDTGALEAFVDQAIAANPGPVADFKAGKKAAAGFFVGQVMKLSKGKADPKIVGGLVAKKLASL